MDVVLGYIWLKVHFLIPTAGALPDLQRLGLGVQISLRVYVLFVMCLKAPIRLTSCQQRTKMQCVVL